MTTKNLRRFQTLLACVITVYANSNSFAGIFDKDVKVKRFLCNPKTKLNLQPGIFQLSTFEIKGSNVFEKIEMVKDGKVMDGKLIKLDNCVVLDDRNWKCGGNYFQDARGRVRESATDQVVKGKYFFTYGDQIPSSAKSVDDLCIDQIN